jgi:hypothetical protein
MLDPSRILSPRVDTEPIDSVSRKAVPAAKPKPPAFAKYSHWFVTPRVLSHPTKKVFADVVGHPVWQSGDGTEDEDRVGKYRGPE